jgi:hypothetical protein
MAWIAMVDFRVVLELEIAIRCDAAEASLG